MILHLFKVGEMFQMASLAKAWEDGMVFQKECVYKVV